MAGISVLQEKPENSSTAYTEMKQGASKRVEPLTYSLGIRTSKELYDDDRYGLVGKKGPTLLARSAAFTKEMIAWNVFNQGFTSAVTTFDGNPLFYNTHALSAEHRLRRSLLEQRVLSQRRVHILTVPRWT